MLQKGVEKSKLAFTSLSQQCAEILLLYCANYSEICRVNVLVKNSVK